LQIFYNEILSVTIDNNFPLAKESTYNSAGAFLRRRNQLTRLQEHSSGGGINLHTCESIPLAEELTYTSAGAFLRWRNQLTRLREYSSGGGISLHACGSIPLAKIVIFSESKAVSSR
jgi:hypothetical protein